MQYYTKYIYWLRYFNNILLCTILMKKQSAFTLVEIILVIVIISIGLMSVVYYVQNTLRQVHHSNQRIIAMNLAKEGIESMYYARNQRILQHPWTDLGTNGGGKELTDTSDRSRCRLALNSENCITQKRILDKGNYSMDFSQTTNGKVNINFTQQQNDINFQEWVFETNKPYALYLSGNERSSDPGDKTDNLTRYGRFFRKIEGKGIFTKNLENWNITKINCNGIYDYHENCYNNTPKEYHFCSVVKYIGAGVPPSEVKFCAIMTNFFPNVNQEG